MVTDVEKWNLKKVAEKEQIIPRRVCQKGLRRHLVVEQGSGEFESKKEGSTQRTVQEWV